jgi:hypothetical protein
MYLLVGQDAAEAFINWFLQLPQMRETVTHPTRQISLIDTLQHASDERIELFAEFIAFALLTCLSRNLRIKIITILPCNYLRN